MNHTVNGISCPHCGKMIDFRTDLELPQVKELKSQLALYESAQELITTPSGRVWIAAEKHEAVVNRLREALEKIASFPEGAVVTSSFDEPHSAQISREALK